MDVNFFSEDVDFSINNENKTYEWLVQVAEKEGFRLGELSFVFCSDDYLHKINLEYLKHDTYTDIVTFDYTEGQFLSGDIFISIDRVTENADKFGSPFEEELNRVIAHGVLHLAGYKDKSAEEQRVMRGKEDFCLTLLS